MSEGLLSYNNIHFVPSFHNRLQFSLEVRKMFSKIKPDAIAVELPDIYYSDVIQAVSRLPKLTMLCLNHDNQDTYAYIPIFPSDSMIEGIRLAKDNGL
ncbi:MAG: conjugal transfer protein TraB, partial [Candidatus Sericytochromatia bacterium]|nr:conjugal transfer protein TraB [Candidatus Sericytochromatia bacterium]